MFPAFNSGTLNRIIISLQVENWIKEVNMEIQLKMSCIIYSRVPKEVDKKIPLRLWQLEYILTPSLPDFCFALERKESMKESHFQYNFICEILKNLLLVPSYFTHTRWALTNSLTMALFAFSMFCEMGKKNACFPNLWHTRCLLGIIHQCSLASSIQQQPSPQSMYTIQVFPFAMCVCLYTVAIVIILRVAATVVSVFCHRTATQVLLMLSVRHCVQCKSVSKKVFWRVNRTQENEDSE